MDLNANLHLTLKLDMSKVKVKHKGHMDSAQQGVHACEVWKSHKFSHNGTERSS